MQGPIHTLQSWLTTRSSRNAVATISDRLTDRARAAIQLAEQEARRLNHEYLGTEHLLFGLANDRGIAAAIMQELTGDLDRICWELKKVMIPGSETASPGTLLLTPRLRKALESAKDEARLLNHKYIGSEHLLLGLLRDPEGLPATVFLAQGVNAKELRSKVLATIGPRDT